MRQTKKIEIFGCVFDELFSMCFPTINFNGQSGPSLRGHCYRKYHPNYVMLGLSERSDSSVNYSLLILYNFGKT